MPVESQLCPVEGCDLARSGKCKRGLASAELCDARTAALGASASGGVQLPSGLELDTEGASVFLRRSWGRVVFLAGGVKSGKTTLISSLYQRFQSGPVAGLQFAGSDTLHAWERICHPSRVASMASRADTERTRLEQEFSFLHVRVRPEVPSAEPADILFSNVSGELFEAMRDHPEECERAKCLGRADRFLMLLDGERLCSAATRASVISEARTLLRRLIDTGSLSPRVPIDLLASKWDMVPEDRRVNVGALLDGLIGSLKSHTTPPDEAAWHPLAARPSGEDDPSLCIGLEDVLKRCAKSIPPTDAPPRPYEPGQRAGGLLRFRGVAV